MKIETQLIAAAFKMIPKNSTRFALNGVHICSAQDGKAMVVGCDSYGLILLHSEFDAPEEPFTIPYEICKQIKYTKKGVKTAEITLDGNNVSVDIGVITLKGQICDGRYPRVHAIYENYEGDKEIPSIFAASLLTKMAQIGRLFDVDERKVHHHNNGDAAAKVVFLSDKDKPLENVIGYIMPIQAYRFDKLIKHNVTQF